MENNHENIMSLIMKVLDIENNLKYIEKEVLALEIEQSRRETLTSITDRYLSALFDVRNKLSFIVKEYGVMMVDILIEDVKNTASVKENIQAISDILKSYNTELQQYTDALISDYNCGLLLSKDARGFFVLMTESVGNIFKNTKEIKDTFNNLIIND